MQIYYAFRGYLKVAFCILIVAVLLWATITAYPYIPLLTVILPFFCETPSYSSLKNDLRRANHQALKYLHTRRINKRGKRRQSAIIPDSI
jgi:uncharacterized protein (UPF0333 family)